MVERFPVYSAHTDLQSPLEFYYIKGERLGYKFLRIGRTDIAAHLVRPKEHDSKVMLIIYKTTYNTDPEKFTLADIFNDCIVLEGTDAVCAFEQLETEGKIRLPYFSLG